MLRLRAISIVRQSDQLVRLQEADGPDLTVSRISIQRVYSNKNRRARWQKCHLLSSVAPET